MNSDLFECVSTAGVWQNREEGGLQGMFLDGTGKDRFWKDGLSLDRRKRLKERHRAEW